MQFSGSCGGRSMIGWLYRAKYRRLQDKRGLSGKKTLDRFATEALENRTLLAATLAAPTLIDPVAPLQVDQNSYALRGALREAARNNTTVSAYRDTNQNGIYNAG